MIDLPEANLGRQCGCRGGVGGQPFAWTHLHGQLRIRLKANTGLSEKIRRSPKVVYKLNPTESHEGQQELTQGKTEESEKPSS